MSDIVRDNIIPHQTHRKLNLRSKPPPPPQTVKNGIVQLSRQVTYVEEAMCAAFLTSLRKFSHFPLPTSAHVHNHVYSANIAAWLLFDFASTATSSPEAQNLMIVCKQNAFSRHCIPIHTQACVCESSNTHSKTLKQ